MVRPSASIAFDRPPVTLGVVVDQSGSMLESSGVPGLSRIGLVATALRASLTSDRLRADDMVSIVGFNNSANALTGLVSGDSAAVVSAALEKLQRCHGSTFLGVGLELISSQLLSAPPGAKRVVVLTDGVVHDEPVALQAASELGARGVTITAIGVGSEWNMTLLSAIANASNGTVMHVIPDSDPPVPPSLRLSELPDALIQQIRQASTEVVTGITLTGDLAPGVRLRRVTRVLPTIIEVAARPDGCWSLGAISQHQGGAFVLDFEISAHVEQGEVSLGSLIVGHSDAAGNLVAAAPSFSINAAFSRDEAASAVVDFEVQQLVQQRNLETIVQQVADAVGRRDPAAARGSLAAATRIAGGVGNSAMTVVLNQAIGDLDAGRPIDPNVLRSAQVGSRTKTVDVGDGWLRGLTDADIRRITGV